MIAFRKHISQACVLIIEARLGYPEHLWLAVGHLSEAESEIIMDHPELAYRVREERVRYITDHSYNIPIMELIQEANDLALQKALQKTMPIVSKRRQPKPKTKR